MSYEALKDAAERNRRSLNAEIVARLDKSINQGAHHVASTDDEDFFGHEKMQEAIKTLRGLVAKLDAIEGGDKEE